MAKGENPSAQRRLHRQGIYDSARKNQVNYPLPVIDRISQSQQENLANNTNDNNSINLAHAPLLVIPPPKDIFVSRFEPQTEPTTILHYLKHEKGIETEVICCEKISKPNSNISSFRIKVPQNLFETICSSSCWPEFTFVKEFKHRPLVKKLSNNNKNKEINKTKQNVQKN